MGHTPVKAHHDFVIIGAGIVGAACAAALARDGHRLLVIDSGPIGGGATGAGMGHIVVMDDSPAQLALTSYSRRLWHELVPELPRQSECDPCGTIWVAADHEEMAAVHQKQTMAADYDVASQVLSRQELAQAEPNLRSNLAGGLLVPDDLVVYPPVVASLLLDKARACGAEVRTRTAVTRIDDQANVWLEDLSSISAQAVIVAAGSWAPLLVPDLPIRPRKGHLAITDRYPGFVRHQLIELGYLKSAHAMQRESVAFNIQPRKTGQMLIGSSRQFDADTSDVEIRVAGRMLRRAIDYLPALTRLSTIRMWTGYRAATDDKLPLIGPLERAPRIWLATGHEGLGIATSLATAELVAAQLAGRKPAIAPEPYQPARLSKRGV